jgi:putative intracellular protease/amidase
MRQIIEGAGGVWHEHASNPMSEYVISEARVVTGMNPASATAVAKEMLKLQPAAPLDGHKPHKISS